MMILPSALLQNKRLPPLISREEACRFVCRFSSMVCLSVCVCEMFSSVCLFVFSPLCFSEKGGGRTSDPNSVCVCV